MVAQCGRERLPARAPARGGLGQAGPPKLETLSPDGPRSLSPICSPGLAGPGACAWFLVAGQRQLGAARPSRPGTGRRCYYSLLVGGHGLGGPPGSNLNAAIIVRTEGRRQQRRRIGL